MYPFAVVVVGQDLGAKITFDERGVQRQSIAAG